MRHELVREDNVSRCEIYLGMLKRRRDRLVIAGYFLLRPGMAQRRLRYERQQVKINRAMLIRERHPAQRRFIRSCDMDTLLLKEPPPVV